MSGLDVGKHEQDDDGERQGWWVGRCGHFVPIINWHVGRCECDRDVVDGAVEPVCVPCDDGGQVAGLDVGERRS